jgi:hypothetical protein
MTDPLKHYKVAGYEVAVFPNRIDVTKSSIFGKRTETFLIKNITNVSSGAGRSLEITLTDGKKHRFMVAGKPAEEMRLAILDLI